MQPWSLRERWIACNRPNPRAQLRLFCFPYAGGGRMPYLDWADHLPRSLEVCIIQLPGRDVRIAEPPLVRIELLVEALAGVVESHACVPFVFFGHSMGALVGFELARELRRRGAQGPRLLLASGFRAPHLTDPRPAMHGLEASAFLQELRKLEGTPEEVLQNAEFLELLLPALRADFAMCETYACADDVPLDCAITVFGGEQDPLTTREELEAWSFQTRRAFRMRMFSGNHFFLQQARLPVLRELALELQRIDPTQEGP